MVKLAILIICLIIFIVKAVSSYANKKSAEGRFNKAKKNPEFAAELSDDVRLFYSKTNAADFDPKHFADKVKGNSYGKYKIADIVETPGKLLLFTKRVHEDWGTKWNGHTGDVKKEQYDFFVVANDMEVKNVTIYGEHYQDLSDKLMKTEFAQVLIGEVS